MKSEDICTKCENNFYLVRDYYNTYCSKIAHCSYIYDDEQKCEECEEAYKLTEEGQCIQKYQIIDNCIRYEYNNDNPDEFLTNCYLCDFGYAISNNKKTCIEFPNCEELNEDNSKCVKCPNGYALNSTGFCEISTCAYSIDNICQECYEGFYLDSNKTCQ